MVDLAKIRKKAKKDKGSAAEAERNAAVPAAEHAASPPPPASETPAPSADEDAGVPLANKLDAFKETAGKRRSAEVAKLDVEEKQRLELLTFVIAGEHYAVDIERIVEIVTPRAVTRIPNADASIVGIISLRGTIVTLVDVRGKLKHPAAREENADTRIVVIDFHNEMIGFVVDRVLRVVKTESGEIEPHPVVHAAELDESIRGVFRANGALTILLDLDKLLDHRWI
ncbi:MAG TPA: chemotaxis protein CheW [Thermoanaerobaculia bacterium]|nr:chemotaxis protein CheW [Thermoanaerobaculia bacterium]